jgi:hypothetical protein
MDFAHCITGQFAMSPHGSVHFDEAESQVSTDTKSDSESQCTDRVLQYIRGDLIADSQQQRQHFFVAPRGDQQDDADGHLHQDDGGSCAERTEPLPLNISSMLELPEIVVKVLARRGGDPLIDYSQSLLLTSEEYIAAMQEKADRRDAARREAERRRQLAEQRKVEKQAEKAGKELEKVQQEAKKTSTQGIQGSVE